jgi:hypothetical protein
VRRRKEPEKPVKAAEKAVPSPPIDVEMRKPEPASVEEYFAAADWLRENYSPKEASLQTMFLLTDILAELRARK